MWSAAQIAGLTEKVLWYQKAVLGKEKIYINMLIMYLMMLLVLCYNVSLIPAKLVNSGNVQLCYCMEPFIWKCLYAFICTLYFLLNYIESELNDILYAPMVVSDLSFLATSTQKNPKKNPTCPWRCIACEGCQYCGDSITAGFRTLSDINITTITMHQGLHSMAFHSQASPVKVMQYLL